MSANIHKEIYKKDENGNYTHDEILLHTSMN